LRLGRQSLFFAGIVKDFISILSCLSMILHSGYEKLTLLFTSDPAIYI
jgi:hypothetical protein